jgi:hypothetical protein
MTVPASVRAAVVDAYYARIMTSSDAARARAQAAYGIASAIAAAVVAAGLFAGVDARPLGVQAVVVAALIAWLGAAFLFLHSVSSPFHIDRQPQSGDDAFVLAVLDAIRNERTRIDSWQRRAQVVSAIAAVLTVVAFVAALRASGDGSRLATIAVTRAAANELARACGSRPSLLIGKVADANLSGEFINVMLEPGACGPSEVEVAVRRADVIAIAFRRPPQ